MKNDGSCGVRVKIFGKVQGVNFRVFILEHALKLNLKGFVCNKPDGSVEAVFEGDKMHIDKILELCHQGPKAARVTRVECIEEKPTTEFKGFFVRR